MKKMFGLVSNEYIKMLKKKSTLIVLALFLLFAMSFPVLNRYVFTSNQGNTLGYQERELRYAQQELESIKEQLQNGGTDWDKAQLISTQVHIEALKLSIEHKISWHDWRDQLVTQYEQERLTVEAIKLFEQGVPADVLRDHLSVSLNTASAQLLEKQLEQAKEQADAVYKMAVNNDHAAYTRLQLAQTKEGLASAEEQLVDAKAALAEKPEDEELKAAVKEAEVNVERTQYSVKHLQYRLENDVTYENDDWRNNMLNSADGYLYQMLEEPVGKDAFQNLQKSGQYPKSMTYEEYVKEVEASAKKASEEYQTTIYGLEHGIPTPEAANSSRASSQSIWNLMTFITLIGAIFAGGLISREYSSGTIRLLLIRPVARWKILLSKYIAAITVPLFLTLASLLAMLLSSGFVYGFGDLALPLLKVVGGQVVEANFFLNLLGTTLVSFISVILMTTAAFMLSVVTKNTAVAVGLSVFATTFGPTATMLLAQLKQKWVIYTPAPYLNLADFFTGSYNFEFYKEALGVTLTVGYGILISVVFTVLFLIAAIWVFQRRDVKN